MVLHAVLPTPYFSPTRFFKELKRMFQIRPRTTGVTCNKGSQFCQSLATIYSGQKTEAPNCCNFGGLVAAFLLYVFFM
jgi:hypothetical protein